MNNQIPAGYYKSGDSIFSALNISKKKYIHELLGLSGNSID